MKSRFDHTIWMLIFCASAASCQAPTAVAPDAPQKVTVCELLKDPKAWDHKLVQVSGTASHDFEESGFYSGDCKSRYTGLWMEYGGERATGTMSTASNRDRTRPKPAVVEGVEVPLVEDTTFRRFDDLLHSKEMRRGAATVKATVVARFFAGRLEHYPRGDFWGGYGHLGCCSLLLVQQVLAVDEPPGP